MCALDEARRKLRIGTVCFPGFQCVVEGCKAVCKAPPECPPCPPGRFCPAFCRGLIEPVLL